MQLAKWISIKASVLSRVKPYLYRLCKYQTRYQFIMTRHLSVRWPIFVVVIIGRAFPVSGLIGLNRIPHWRGYGGEKGVVKKYQWPGVQRWFCRFSLLQCRHLIPALNAWAVRACYTTARPIGTQIHGHGCMDYLKIERRCYQIATLRSLMCLGYFLTCYPWGFIQPGTGRRPVDWCRN